jgi:maltooligosyltrehalose trehalohydrolase
MKVKRRLPVGAELQQQFGTSFRIWAPNAKKLSLVLNGDLAFPWAMQPENDGYWSLTLPGSQAGDSYQFCINESDQLYPDPASRYQPDGPHGASYIVDPFEFAWTDSAWKGVTSRQQVLYEMHIGTFTKEGTYRAASKQLKELAELGITTIELMPIGEFDGKAGWGYDVVGLFAPYHHYGSPDELRGFVDEAHRQGLAVILDVIYNHFGPSGAYQCIFSDHYFSDKEPLDWGKAINFDGPGSGPVREYFISNARYWIEEFHFDGLRLDATHFMRDDSEVHIISEIVRQARKAAGDRTLYLIGEMELQQSWATNPVETGGYGLDAVWNDDFHHSANVALRGKREAYFHDYKGTAQELVSLIKWGYLYQGQYYAWQEKNRGTPTLDKAPSCFINFLQNHDQIANSGFGKRIHQIVRPGAYRAMTALLLLTPQTPLLFQGQEFGASSPFIFFADHEPELAASVEKGRFEFLSQFPSLNTPSSKDFVSSPEAFSTFEKCKLDLSEREKHADTYLLHKDLLALRHQDPVFSTSSRLDGAVINESAFVLRFFASVGNTDRILIVNLGQDIWMESIAEPLFAPPTGHQWQQSWSSEHPQYGGDGIRDIDLGKSFVIPGASAVVFNAAPTGTE